LKVEVLPVKLKTLRPECFPSHLVKGDNEYYHKLYPIMSYIDKSRMG